MWFSEDFFKNWLGTDCSEGNPMRFLPDETTMGSANALPAPCYCVSSSSVVTPSLPLSASIPIPLKFRLLQTPVDVSFPQVPYAVTCPHAPFLLHLSHGGSGC